MRSPLADYCERRYIAASARGDSRAMTFWARAEYAALYSDR